jgi:hypothetical protein
LILEFGGANHPLGENFSLGQNSCPAVARCVSLCLHDLRGAGLTWAATQEANARELMARAGHASPAAALRYQHATADRDVAIAAALSGLAESAHERTQRLGPRDIRGMDDSLPTTAESSQRH